MARDGSGNYSLPAGNPVVTGTTITISWANTTLSDIATALTASVARDGQSAMTGTLNMGSNAISSVTTIAASGAVTAASLIPTSATVPANGMYLSAANTVAFATNGVLRASIDTSGNLVITGGLSATTGTFSSSISAVGATITGTILLGGVNVTDYARLSQSNPFTGATQSINNATNGAGWTLTGGGANGAFFSLTTPAIGAGATSNHSFGLYSNNTLRLDISNGGNFDFKAGTVTSNNASASEVGYKGLPQNSQSVDYTLALTDADKNLHQTGASKTFTIPANASVAFPIGTVLNFTTDNATGCSIAITTDTLRLAGTATTGTRTLAQYGIATAIKILSTTWLVSGAGLS